MIPGEYDINIRRDKTWSITVAKKDSNDVYINFDTTYIDQPAEDDGDIVLTMRPPWKVDPTKPKPDPLLTLSYSNGDITSAGTTLTITLSAAATAALTFTEAYYELDLITGDATPVKDMMLFGKVHVKDQK